MSFNQDKDHAQIAAVVLDSWDKIGRYVKPGWIYRGQKSATWTLRTSLERCCEREAVSFDNHSYIEEELGRDFKRAYHHYSSHVPSRNSTIEWASIMQHHGAPTRLLDFTYSIYVAAYFALEVAACDCAVWAVDSRWALCESEKLFRLSRKPKFEQLQTRTLESHETVGHHLLFEPPFVKAVVMITPFRLNERLRTQHGTFLVPGDVSSDFMDNLEALPGHDQASNIVKIVIPYKLRKEAVASLYNMNISRTSLFPGLDGYAQSLGVFHSSFIPDPHSRGIV